MAWKKTQIKKFINSLAIVSSLFACTQKQDSNSQSKNDNQELRVLTWSEYFDDEVIKSFEEKNHAKVIRDYFASNEELLAKIKSNLESSSRGYDLILPSDYMVQTMTQLGMLKKIDKDQLTVLQNLDPKFQHPVYDSQLDYCVPFAWGTTGIAINYVLAPALFSLRKGRYFGGAELSAKMRMPTPRSTARIFELNFTSITAPLH
jgi:spermidine/putrescine-binding protein